MNTLGSTCFEGHWEMPALPALRRSCLRFVENAVADIRSEDPFFQLCKSLSGKKNFAIDAINIAHSLLDIIWPLNDPTEREAASKRRHVTLVLYKRALHLVLVCSLKELGGVFREDTEAQGIGMERSKQQYNNDVEQIQQHRNQHRCYAWNEILEDILAGDGELLCGLVNACVEIVDIAYGQGDERGLIDATERLGRTERRCFELWMGFRWLQLFHHYSQDGGQGSSTYHLEPWLAYISVVKQRIVSHLAFASGSSLFYRLIDIFRSKDTFCNDKRAIEEFLRELAVLAEAQTLHLCSVLADQNLYVGHTDLRRDIIVLLAHSTAKAVCSILYHHLDIMFGNNLSVLITCCLYFTAKLHRIGGLKLNLISSTFLKCFPVYRKEYFESIPLVPLLSCPHRNREAESMQRILKERHSVALSNDCAICEEDSCERSSCTTIRTGGIRQYYNEIFLPMCLHVGIGQLYGSIHARLMDLVASMQRANDSPTFITEKCQSIPAPVHQEEEPHHNADIVSTKRKAVDDGALEKTLQRSRTRMRRFYRPLRREQDLVYA